MSEAAREDARPLPGIAALLDTYDEISAKGIRVEAVAAFYAFETQVPELAAQKSPGVRRFYGLSEPHSLAYFVVHEEADGHHRAAWRACGLPTRRIGTASPSS